MTEIKPRILLIGNFLSEGGFTLQMSETLSALFRSRNYIVLTASDKHFKPYRLFDIVRAALFRANDYDIAVIDIFSGSAFWFAYYAARGCSLAGKPYVLLLHGGNLPDFLDGCAEDARSSIRHLFLPHPLYGRARAIHYRAFFRNAARIVCPSSYLASELHQRGFHSEQIANGIDLAFYNFNLRRTVRPRLFWLRSFSEIYNPLLALQVLKGVRKRYPDACLTMAGPDKGLLAACKRFADDSGLTGAVSFPGCISKSEINRLGQEHDIFLNTTNVDNMPVSVTEAMALGMPVVTTDVGGMLYMVRNNETALLVPPRNSAVMRDAVLRLLGSPDLCARLSEQGRSLAESLSLDRIALQWSELFNSLRRGERG